MSSPSALHVRILMFLPHSSWQNCSSSDVGCSWIAALKIFPQIHHPDWGLGWDQDILTHSGSWFEPLSNSFGTMIRAVALLQGEALCHAQVSRRLEQILFKCFPLCPSVRRSSWRSLLWCRMTPIWRRRGGRLKRCFRAWELLQMCKQVNHTEHPLLMSSVHYTHGHGSLDPFVTWTFFFFGTWITRMERIEIFYIF